MSNRIEAKVTHRYRASPERVFDAFLDPALARRWQAAWLHRTGRTGRLSRSEIDPRVGGDFVFAELREGDETRHRGRFLALERPTKVAFSWFADAPEENDADEIAMIIEPEPNGPGSIVTLYDSMGALEQERLAQAEKTWLDLLWAIEDVIERRDIPMTLNA